MSNVISKKSLFSITAIFCVAFFCGYALHQFIVKNQDIPQLQTDTPLMENDESTPTDDTHPLTIEILRKTTYPGSTLITEEILTPSATYNRSIVSYQSEGNKIYALLTIPNGNKPQNGWPVIIFNHGYIPPEQYRTTERYVAYVGGFARNGYIVLRPDYRGHGNSEGEAVGGYGSNVYTIDVLNAVASIKKVPDADAEKIGMWGHSMGGHITLRNMVVNKDIKAGVIWAGVVASYPDLLNNWRRRNLSLRPTLSGGARRWRDQLVETYGEPAENPTFWNAISATSYLDDISGPIQLHHGTDDTSVPVEFSEKLATLLKQEGKIVELYTYLDDDHNITNNFSIAMRRSVTFFDTYLKNN